MLFRSNTNFPLMPVTGIFPETEFGKLIRSVEQRPTIKIITASKIITLSGRRARVALTNSLSVASDVKVEEEKLPAAKPMKKSIYTSTDVSTGPSFDILPYVSADRSAIELTVTVNLTEFLGYDDPGPFGPSGPDEPVDRKSVV